MAMDLNKNYWLTSIMAVVAMAGIFIFDSARQFILEKVSFIADKAGQTKNSLTPTNFRKVLGELSDNDSFNYVNKGTLTENYFRKAEKTLSDGRLYLVISHTGSAACDIISVFTGKNFNHASISFDRELKTAVSYNSGNNVYPPGMNPEMLADFIRKEGDSMLVYSLPCPPENKARVLRKIREINERGSAYNMIGLMTKKSYRPNIMFCSQFVYKMLETAGLGYFNKRDGTVQPTDFIELDYQRDLTFEYEVAI